MARIFFISIKSFPSIDFTSLSELIAITALIGLLTTLATIILMVLPSFFLTQIWDGLYKSEKTIKSAAREAFVFSSLITSFIAFDAWLAIINKHEPYMIWVTIIVILLIFIGCVFYFHKQNKSDASSHENKKPNWTRALWACSALFVTWFFSESILMIVAYIVAKESDSWPIFSGVLFILVVLNHLILAFSPNSDWLKGFGITMLVATMLLFIFLLYPSEASTNFIRAPFRILNIGNISDAQLVVKKETCDYVNAISITRELEEYLYLTPLCDKKDEVDEMAGSGIASQKTKDDSFGIISNVKILSAIGNEFLITRIPEPQKNKNIILKKEDVLMWRVTAPTKAK